MDYLNSLPVEQRVLLAICIVAVVAFVIYAFNKPVDMEREDFGDLADPNYDPFDADAYPNDAFTDTEECPGCVVCSHPCEPLVIPDDLKCTDQKPYCYTCKGKGLSMPGCDECGMIFAAERPTGEDGKFVKGPIFGQQFWPRGKDGKFLPR